ncbi:hypothetical protein ACFLSV_03745 [Bacteroidota bacterium]
MLKKLKIILFLFVLISGCGLFDTRDVEPPTDPRSNFTPPTSPDIVIVNLQFAVAEKNLNNYMACFVDTNFSSRKFNYQADVSSQVQYPTIFLFWNLSSEKSYYTTLLALTNAQSNSHLFLSDEMLSISLDTAIYDADYLLRFEHQRPTVAQTLKGKLRFYLAADSRNLWSIHSWFDFKEPTANDTTWSVLKANFLN